MQEVKLYAEEWGWTCPICKERVYQLFGDEIVEHCDVKYKAIYPKHNELEESR